MPKKKKVVGIYKGQPLYNKGDLKKIIAAEQAGGTQHVKSYNLGPDASLVFKTTQAVSDQPIEIWAGPYIQTPKDADMVLDLANGLKQPGMTGRNLPPSLQNLQADSDDPRILLHFGWPDMGIPKLTQTQWLQIIGSILTDANASKVYVCCVGGKGRTGTALAIIGVMLSLIPEGKDPVQWVRNNYYKDAVETKAQAEYVENITGRKVEAATFKYADGGVVFTKDGDPVELLLTNPTLGLEEDSFEAALLACPHFKRHAGKVVAHAIFDDETGQIYAKTDEYRFQPGDPRSKGLYLLEIGEDNFVESATAVDPQSGEPLPPLPVVPPTKADPLVDTMLSDGDPWDDNNFGITFNPKHMQPNGWDETEGVWLAHEKVSRILTTHLRGIEEAEGRHLLREEAAEIVRQYMIDATLGG